VLDLRGRTAQLSGKNSRVKLTSFLRVFGYLLALKFVNVLAAAEPPVLYEQYAPRTTGGSELFWTAAQDDRGVMFFGCDDLITFDGERWQRHSVEDVFEIRSIAFGEQGRIWIAAMNEIGYCDRSASGEIGKFHSLREHLPDPSARLGEVWYVLVRGTETIFVTKTQVLVWDGSSFVINEFPGAPRLVAVKIDGEIYVTHRHRGIWKLAGKKLEPFLTSESLGENDVGINGLVKNGDAWFIVTTKGLIKFENGHVERIRSKVSDFLQTHFVIGACRLSDGRFCIGTLGGILLVSADGNLEEVIEGSDELGSTHTYFVFADRDDAVWACSGSNLERFALKERISVFGPKQGLRSKYCTGVTEIGSKIFVSAITGVYTCDTDQRPLGFNIIGGSESLVFYDILSDRGRVYAGGYRGVYELTDGVRVHTPLRQDVLVLRRSFRPGVFLASSAASEILKIEADHPGESKKLQSFQEGPLSIVQREDDELWFGMRSLGTLVAPHDGSVVSVESGGIRRGRCLVTTAGKYVVVCSAGGVTISGGFNQKSQWVERSPQTVPLALSAENQNSVWAAFTSPFPTEPKTAVLGRIDVDHDGNGHWTPYAVEGLDRLGNINAIFQDSKGFVWLAGFEGTLRFDPKTVQPVSAPRAPVLQASVSPGAELPYGGNTAVFDLATAEYGRRAALRFQTKLAGLSHQWSEPTSDARVQLTGLRDGSYEFSARLVNDAGMTGPTTTWQFRVLPPWYRTKTAYSAWTALLAAAVFGLVQWRSSYLRQQNLRLEALVRKKTEQLEQANQAKTDFIADMSHEIRNPISGIVGLSLAMEETSLDERQRQLTDSIRSCASLLATLVDDVLDFSKIEAGKIDLRLAPFEVRSILEQCAAMVSEDARRAGARLSLQIEAEVPPRLLGDAARIQQIILNYLTNAVKFASAGAIIVGAKRISPERIRFFVQDHGPGMNDTEAAQLFTKFARLEKARANNVRGSGLGLAVCRLLAGKMGGRVGVDTKIGHGSCFWAELPLPIATEPLDRPAAPAPSGPALRALIVEDIDYNAAAMQAVLRKLGVQSDVVTDGPSALEQLQRTFYDVAFMDWNLPGMIGTEVVSRFRAVESPQRRTIIIATTAYSAEFNREACLQAGMDAFIGKPLTPEKIAVALRDLRGTLRSAASVEVSRAPVEPASASSAYGQIDLQMLRFLADNTPEGLRGQITRYLASFEKDRQTASEAIQQGEAQAIHRIAHRLASHASMVRYEPLRELAAALESRAASSKREELNELLAAFDREFETFRKKLDSIHSSTGSA
jgi:signal transduction histidine kinase/CheY-like chemotaxis protein/HPt (histidine-containing phosphotransfer) domain-containing protein